MNQAQRDAAWRAYSTDSLNLAMNFRMYAIAAGRARLAEGGYTLSELRQVGTDVNEYAHEASLIAAELRRRAARGELICAAAREWQD